RLDPEVQDRLRPKPSILGPPERDPIVASEHFACDLAVVCLPRIPQREESEHREVEDRADGDHPESVPFPERTLEPELVTLPWTELFPELEHCGDQAEKAARHE